MIPLAHQRIKACLSPLDWVVDATCGNGQDTLFLAACVPQGKVFALDIQEKAIARTKEKLTEAGVENLVELVHSSHSPFPACIPQGKIKLFVYNFGYLPGGDKRVTTLTESSLASVKEALSLLAPGGALSLMLYPGHPEGAKEAECLLQFARELAANRYSVFRTQTVNRHLAPEHLWIQEIPPPSGSSGSGGRRH